MGLQSWTRLSDFTFFDLQGMPQTVWTAHSTKVFCHRAQHRHLLAGVIHILGVLKTCEKGELSFTIHWMDMSLSKLGVGDGQESLACCSPQMAKRWLSDWSCIRGKISCSPGNIALSTAPKKQQRWTLKCDLAGIINPGLGHLGLCQATGTLEPP